MKEKGKIFGLVAGWHSLYDWSACTDHNKLAGSSVHDNAGVNTEIFVPLVQSVKSSIWVSHLL